MIIKIKNRNIYLNKNTIHTAYVLNDEEHGKYCVKIIFNNLNNSHEIHYYEGYNLEDANNIIQQINDLMETV
jgi:hypothetical protein